MKLLCLVPLLLPCANAQNPALDPLSAALAEPASPGWDAAAGKLRIGYGAETLFEGALQVRASESEPFRAPQTGEVLFAPALRSGTGTEQIWKFEPAPGAALTELQLAGELRTSAEGLAAETRGEE